MTNRKEIASMTVGGKEYSGWEDVSITRSIENACSNFSFASTMYNPKTREEFTMKVGEECVIKIDDEVVITGYIDEISPSHDPGSHSIPVSGRSKTCDIVDCSVIVKPGQWNKQKIEEIAKKACADYGVDVVAEVDTGDEVVKHVVETGESVYETIERLTKSRGLLLTDNPDGNLVLTRAGNDRATDPIIMGENLLTCSARFSVTNRFSEYRCIGQRAGGGKKAEKEAGKKVSQSYGLAEDDAIERKRVLVLTAEEQADNKRCKDRAVWEAATRAGRSTELSIKVQGWTQSDGNLWKPNTIVHVKDHLINVDDEFLIVEVSYQKSGSGTVTELKLAPEMGYLFLAPIEQGSKKKAGQTGYHKSLEK